MIGVVGLSLLSSVGYAGSGQSNNRCFPLSYTMGNGVGFLLQRGTLGGAALYLEEHSWCADGSDGVAVLPVPSWEGGIDGVRAILRAYEEAYPDRPTYIATPVEGGILVAPTRGPRTVDRPVTLPDAGTVRDGERSIVEQIGIRPGDAPSVAHGCAREPAVGRRSGTLLQVLRELNGP